ncbi:hypothetical protein ONA23_06930 [Mycoplasmopsis cynos]|nr:hypothetical protein [Mycoplasmopsis cynos]WAM06626.1 hypothetical protein ONA23_06930 [Mycoplasmopsis cynos]
MQHLFLVTHNSLALNSALLLKEDKKIQQLLELKNKLPMLNEFSQILFDVKLYEYFNLREWALIYNNEQ